MPHEIQFDAARNLFIVERDNHAVRRVDARTGRISTIAGTGAAGFSGDGGPAVNARLNGPQSVIVGRDGSLFIQDQGNRRIRRVAPDGIITTYAGRGTTGFSGDGGPANIASLSNPTGIAVDAQGNLFIADRGNQRIRRVDAVTKIITTVAGNGSWGFGGDGGPATSARLFFPAAVALDAGGNLFIADRDNARIRRVDAATGIITTVAGDGTFTFSGDGGAATSAGMSIAAIGEALRAGSRVRPIHHAHSSEMPVATSPITPTAVIDGGGGLTGCV